MTSEKETMKRIRREAQAWAVRLASGQVTADDAAAFRLWCATDQSHATAFVEAREVWRALEPASRLAGASAAPRIIKNRVPMQPGRRAFLGGAVAASVTWLAFRPPVGLWPSVAEWSADVRTATGEQREVLAGRDVVIQMNTQTRLNLADSTVGGETTLIELLAGEAEVVARSRAAVRLTAGGATVTGEGARFNVRHTGDDACVTCLDGRVVVSREAHRVTLTAGTQVSWGPDFFGDTLDADAAQVSGWRQRVLVFNQAPLAAVVDEVNRYRPGRIVLTSQALGATRVQASLSLQRLDDVIALIRDVYGAEVTRLPGGIVLLGRRTA